MAAVEIRDVRKSYGELEVIHGVSTRFEDGEFVVIVGPSGCGKSTLLRMIAGLEAISGGEIAIGGRAVNDLEPRARDVAMVFQYDALYPHMSVFDNIAYALKLAKRPPLLFDLEADPGQFRNLAEDHDYQGRTLEYAQAMLSWRLAHADRRLTGYSAGPEGLLERR